MSAVDRLGWPLFASELRLLFGRRRNQALLAVLAALPIVIAVAVRINHGARSGGGGDALFGNVTDNGAFVAFAALAAVLTFFLPLATAVVAGDAVAGEASSGTLRYLLVIPVPRGRVLAVKYVSLLAWCLVSTALVAVVGLVVGVILFGTGPVVLLSGTTVPLSTAITRLLLVILYVALMMAAVAAIGLFASTLTEVPVAAMAATLTLVITSEVMDSVPQLARVQPWLPSHYWLDFADLLRDPMAFEQVRHGSWVALAYVAIFVSAAWARFGGKDVTS